MRYIIVAPPFTVKSAGIFVLYELQKWLIKFGKDAIILNSGHPDMIDDNDIVIYPEIVKGNPLQAKKVVRYVLNEPGKLGGDKEYDVNDFLVAFDGTLSHFTKGEVLRIPHIEEFFANRGYERKVNCYWIGKGINSHHPVTEDCIEITYEWPAKRRELAELFNKTKIFYTYDDRTALVTEAQLCGCEVKIIKESDIYDAPPPGLLSMQELQQQIERFISLTWKETDLLKAARESVDKQLREKLKLIEKRRADHLTSIIIPVFNQLNYTIECYENIERFTPETHEIIFVDNASTDGSKEWLSEISKKNANCRVLSNTKNIGFPGAVNQGFLAAVGKYIVVANNDIIVTEGWLGRLKEIAESDPSIGLVGPISNRVSGVQLDKDAAYKDVPEMHKYAEKISVDNKKRVFEFPRLAFLCTLIKKELIERIGGLDERFSPGNYEDDDFCLRSQLAGYKAAVAQAVFIHHYGSKSFDSEGYDKHNNIREINAEKFKNKWGASPDDIWIHEKKIRERSIRYPIDKNEFTQAFERGILLLEDQDAHLAAEEFHIAKAFFDKRPVEKYAEITLQDINNLEQNAKAVLEIIEKTNNPSNNSEQHNTYNSIKYAEKLIEEDKIDEAENILSRLNLETGPNPDILNDLAVIKILKGELKDAAAYISEILNSDPENETALENFNLIKDKL
ncbi:MAG: glycosyltransferase [Syntrophothermus sp.]